MKWEIPISEEFPKGYFNLDFIIYDSQSNPITITKEISKLFIVLPHIIGDINDLDYSSISILSPTADEEISNNISDLIFNSTLNFVENLTIHLENEFGFFRDRFPS